MASQISWLDASPEEQRRVREIVQMFSLRETQDELGGRQVVVVLSDALFPGTSVLHSRARYLLFVPWLCKIASKRTNKAQALDTLERKLIAAFRADDTVDEADRLVGLVGREAGELVKQLPSTGYWTALSAWGILQQGGTRREVLEWTAAGPCTPEADELADRVRSIWNPGVGEAPKGFPTEDIAGGFRLTRGEATWLRERWLATTEDSMLAHLAQSSVALDLLETPWEEEVCQSAPPKAVEVLRQAQRFSLALEGAQLLYNTVLTDAYVNHGFDHLSIDRDLPRSWLDEWARRVDDAAPLFEDWSSAEFWSTVRRRNPRVSPWTQHFFDIWFKLVAEGNVHGLAGNAGIRKVVVDRELFVKKPAQSRLANTKMLAAWRGAVGARVTYRWPQVRQLVDDLHQGLGVERAGT
jgi:hypothetical protein